MRRTTSQVLNWLDQGWSPPCLPNLSWVNQTFSPRNLELWDWSLLFICDWAYCLLPWCWWYSLPSGKKNWLIPNINGTSNKPITFLFCFFFLALLLLDWCKLLTIFLSYYKFHSDRFCFILQWFYGGSDLWIYLLCHFH